MSTTVNVKTSLGQNGCTLNTLELSVQFHSALHFRDVPQHVPVQVSIRLSDEWVTLLPIVQDVSKNKLTAMKPLVPAMFPFLPLPSLFEYTDTCQWQQLAEQIEHCLLADPFLNSNHPECYHFMLELFWMAFVAANPEFPRGKWPRWNALIPMEGEFISHWMLNSEDVEFIDVPLHFIIWEQFRSLISDTLLMPSTQ